MDFPWNLGEILFQSSFPCQTDVLLIPDVNMSICVSSIPSNHSDHFIAPNDWFMTVKSTENYIRYCVYTFKELFFLIKVNSFGGKGHWALGWKPELGKSGIESWIGWNLTVRLSGSEIIDWIWEFWELWLIAYEWKSGILLLNKSRKFLIILAPGQLQGSKWVWNKSSKNTVNDVLWPYISPLSL